MVHYRSRCVNQDESCDIHPHNTHRFIPALLKLLSQAGPAAASAGRGQENNTKKRRVEVVHANPEKLYYDCISHLEGLSLDGPVTLTSTESKREKGNKRRIINISDTWTLFEFAFDAYRVSEKSDSEKLQKFTFLSCIYFGRGAAAYNLCKGEKHPWTSDNFMRFYGQRKAETVEDIAKLCEAFAGEVNINVEGLMKSIENAAYFKGRFQRHGGALLEFLPTSLRIDILRAQCELTMKDDNKEKLRIQQKWLLLSSYAKDKTNFRKLATVFGTSPSSSSPYAFLGEPAAGAPSSQHTASMPCVRWDETARFTAWKWYCQVSGAPVCGHIRHPHCDPSLKTPFKCGGCVGGKKKNVDCLAFKLCVDCVPKYPDGIRWPALVSRRWSPVLVIVFVSHTDSLLSEVLCSRYRVSSLTPSREPTLVPCPHYRVLSFSPTHSLLSLLSPSGRPRRTRCDREVGRHPRPPGGGPRRVLGASAGFGPDVGPGGGLEAGRGGGTVGRWWIHGPPPWLPPQLVFTLQSRCAVRICVRHLRCESDVQRCQAVLRVRTCRNCCSKAPWGPGDRTYPRRRRPQRQR